VGGNLIRFKLKLKIKKFILVKFWIDLIFEQFIQDHEKSSNLNPHSFSVPQCIIGLDIVDSHLYNPGGVIK
jgi:hypothetical protein